MQVSSKGSRSQSSRTKKTAVETTVETGVAKQAKE